MKKQKICIIGGGLTGLITALALSKLNINVDVITDNNKAPKSNRTIAISQNNYEFLRKLNIFKFKKKQFWPCSKMKLYGETKNKKFNEIFYFSNDKMQKKHILYMMENSEIIKKLIKKIKKNKLISLKTKGKISKIITSGMLKSIKTNNKNYSNYNLIILCTGNNSNLVKNIFRDKSLEHHYDEVSITTTLNHTSIKNTTVRQVFLNKEILALLPLSNTRTSIVWTLKKKILSQYKNKKGMYIKNQLKFYASHFLKNIKFNSNIELKNLNLFIRKKYFQDRILLFGEALHVVHPFVGQGFNMVLRDLLSLENLLKQKISLGLDIGSYDILDELSDKIKPENVIYALGIDFLKNFFSFEKKAFQNFRNKILTKLNDSSFAKNMFFNLANKGFKF